MKNLRHLLLSISLIICSQQFVFTQSEKPFWDKAYLNIDYNLCSSPSLSVAAGYKFSQYMGLGLKAESIDRYRQMYGVHFRGTTLQQEKRYGWYYSFSLGIMSTREEVNQTLGNMDLGVGLQWERMGVGLGVRRAWSMVPRDVEFPYAEECLQLRISQLFGDYRGETAFTRATKRIFRHNSDGKFRPIFFQLVLGAGNANEPIFSSRHGFNGGIMIQTALGIQFNDYLGIGGVLNAAGTFSEGYKYNLGSWGFCLNGYPKSFHYKVVIGILDKYHLEDYGVNGLDREFEKLDGKVPVEFQLHLGVRMFRGLVLGAAYNFSTPVTGNLKTYEWIDNPSTTQTLISEEVYKVNYHGFSVYFGVAL